MVQISHVPALLGIHFLQPTVFVFKLFEPGNHGCIRAAELGAPLVKGCTAKFMLACVHSEDAQRIDPRRPDSQL